MIFKLRRTWHLLYLLASGLVSLFKYDEYLSAHIFKTSQLNHLSWTIERSLLASLNYSELVIPIRHCPCILVIRLWLGIFNFILVLGF